MGYSIGVVCSIGVGPARGGRERNEDNYLICQGNEIVYRNGDREEREPGNGDGVLLAVCDGMGGHDDGEKASTIAARVMAKLHRPGVPKNPAKALMRYIQDAHRRLYWKARANGPVSMGTTLSVVWLFDARAAWSQVGDSRVYLYRDRKLIQLTPDHTRNEFARRDGKPSTRDGDHLCQNFIYGSRGIGDNSSLRMEGGLDCGVEILLPGDRLLLCSDGLWGSVDDVSLAQVLEHTHDPQAAAVACVDRAIARGSTDNITVMVVRVDSLDKVGFDDSDIWDDDESTLAF